MEAILVIILWIAYSVMEGVREAGFWHYKCISESTPRYKSIDNHTMFTLQRLIVGGSMVCLCSEYSVLDVVVLGLSMMLVFPFLHDGAYYTERNNLCPGVYPKCWLDQSTTSTAVLTKIFTPTRRIIAACIGVLVLIKLIT